MSDAFSFALWLLAVVAVCLLVDLGVAAIRRIARDRALARRCMPAPTIVLVLLPRRAPVYMPPQRAHPLDRNN